MSLERLRVAKLLLSLIGSIKVLVRIGVTVNLDGTHFFICAEQSGHLELSAEMVPKMAIFQTVPVYLE